MTKDKIEKLIAQLTLQEKVDMIHGNDFSQQRVWNVLEFRHLRLQMAREVSERISETFLGKR